MLRAWRFSTLGVILTEKGYVTPGTTPTYYYYLKDHQGNNRVVINQGGAVQQVNHYYPFGGVFGEGLQTSKQRYRYNGKKLDTELELNMYDYGARHYDAALGRWFTVDPLAEKYYGISPYVYCANNLVKYVDSNGKWIESVWDVISLATGTSSFVGNVKQGKVGAAIVDGLGIVVDAATVVLPVVPGRVGVAIKGVRGGNKAIESHKVVKNSDAMQELSKSAETGREAHRQIQNELKEVDLGAQIEKKIELKDRNVRKDAVKYDGTAVIIKPNTPSGQKSTKTRENLMQKNDKKTETILYDPKNPAIQKDSPTYIGPKKKN